MTISSHSTKEKISLNKQQIEAGACREILGGNMLIYFFDIFSIEDKIEKTELIVLFDWKASNKISVKRFYKTF